MKKIVYLYHIRKFVTPEMRPLVRKARLLQKYILYNILQKYCHVLHFNYS